MFDRLMKRLGWTRTVYSDAALEFARSQHESLVKELESVRVQYRETRGAWMYAKGALEQAEKDARRQVIITPHRDHAGHLYVVVNR